jgi:hemolysin activation/secretion protein
MIFKTVYKRIFLFVVFGEVMFPVVAQSLPDAGQTLRDLHSPESGIHVTKPIIQQAGSVPELPTTAAAESSVINVESIRITGASAVSPAELAPLVLPWVGRKLSFSQLNEAANRITQYYRDLGYLVARAYVPAQTAANGSVEIAVLEGKLGALKLQNSSRIAESSLRKLASQVKLGEAFHVKRAERGLLLIKDLPGVAALNAVLQPGDTTGTTDLLVDVIGGPLVTGLLDLDNYGNSYTGTYRLGGTVYVNSPFRLGDQLSVRSQVSDHKLYYGRLAYQVPLGSSGLNAGIAYGISRYYLGRQYAELEANGTAQSSTLFLSYPLVRTQSFNLTSSLTAEMRRLRDRIDMLGLVTDKTSRQVAATMNASRSDDNSAWAASAAYSVGNLAIDTPSVGEIDEISARTAGHFEKWRYFGNGILKLNDYWSIGGLVNGQFASKNLDSSEKITLGGPEGVRAYPQGEGAGDEGYVLSAELRYAFRPSELGQVQLGGFVDHGAVRINHNPFLDTPNRRHLSAYGLSLIWALPEKVQMRASVARKLGSEPAQSDADSTIRAWVQAVKSF